MPERLATPDAFHPCSSRFMCTSVFVEVPAEDSSPFHQITHTDDTLECTFDLPVVYIVQPIGCQFMSLAGAAGRLGIQRLAT